MFCRSGWRVNSLGRGSRKITNTLSFSRGREVFRLSECQRMHCEVKGKSTPSLHIVLKSNAGFKFNRHHVAYAEDWTEPLARQSSALMDRARLLNQLASVYRNTKYLTLLLLYIHYMILELNYKIKSLFKTSTYNNVKLHIMNVVV